MKAFGNQWKDQCERSLFLAKRLGNIYTGSLYNGLLSLLCDSDICLEGKKICMFSYGSGCAASMFILHCRPGYQRIRDLSDFKPRLASRVKISPQAYSDCMTEREKAFGQAGYSPKVSNIVETI